MLYFIVFFLQITLAVFIFFLCISFITGGPFVPSTNEAAEAMVDLAAIKKGETAVDLGSGNGKLLFRAAGRGARAIGYEINPILCLYTRLRAGLSPDRDRIAVYWKNFWKADIRQADIVFLYLLPWNMDKLHLNFLKSLKPGTRIVTNSFLFSSQTPAKKDEKHHVFMYIMK